MRTRIEQSPSQYEPDLVLPPGDTLAELLHETGMSQTALARRTGLSTKHVNQIIKGLAAITPDTSLLLERATGVRARVWNSLEAAYREHQSRKEEDSAFAADADWLSQLPVKHLLQRGCIAQAPTPAGQVREICRFFGVANREAFEAVWQTPIAFRKSRAFQSNPGALAAWLRIGEIAATRVRVNPFDRSRLNALLQEFRTLSCEPDPGVWWPELERLCASAGVVVVAEKEVPGARINGAARWLSPAKALVQLSLRHRWNDIFWFTLFHEVGHLLVHSKKESFINDIGSHSGVEQEADAFASQTLIPVDAEIALGDLRTNSDVVAFAKEVGVAPGIVVGRLQHDERWPFNRGNDLRQRLEISG
jgi:HTH-type transcriptional regulator/antitoxin HigA